MYSRLRVPTENTFLRLFSCWFYSFIVLYIFFDFLVLSSESNLIHDYSIVKTRLDYVLSFNNYEIVINTLTLRLGRKYNIVYR